jgi:hypothetical protein
VGVLVHAMHLHHKQLRIPRLLIGTVCLLDLVEYLSRLSHHLAVVPQSGAKDKFLELIAA